MTGTLGSGKGAVRKAFRLAILRYALAFLTVAAALALRKFFEPITGTGAPFVLFFAAVAVSAMVGGPGPGVCATLLSLPLGAYIFVVRAGYHPVEAASQAALFALDGLIVVYLSLGMTRARRAAETSAAAQHDLIELAPDGFFLADLDGQFTDANQSGCRMLGLERRELISKRIPDVLAPTRHAVSKRRVPPCSCPGTWKEGSGTYDEATAP